MKENSAIKEVMKLESKGLNQLGLKQLLNFLQQLSYQEGRVLYVTIANIWGGVEIGNNEDKMKYRNILI
eukprot:snap_masked-scaffold_60-processed-gene-0.6-mRNA-1 protein AED:1.00 eAED:1.00 QI:0/0/0/0/1/1/2/0/68